MFTIISIMFIGIGIGYLMRNVQMLQKVEKSASLTILLLLFVLGVSIGSNRLIVDNLGRFGWQAAVLASLFNTFFFQIELGHEFVTAAQRSFERHGKSGKCSSNFRF